MTTRVIQLPLRLDKNLVPKLKEVCLYVKEGAGEWHCASRVNPGSSIIGCELPRDGEYGMTIVTVDQQGNLSPTDLSKGPPGIVVLVDTRQNRAEPAAPVVQTSAVAGQEVVPTLPATTTTSLPEGVPVPPLANPPVPSPASVPVPSAAAPSAVLPPPSVPEAVAPAAPALPAAAASPPAAGLPAQRPEAMSPRLPAAKRYLNSTRVGLDYTVKKAGPSGISKIDVYVAPEHGGIWKKLTTVTDPTNHSEIELPSEGVFGIRLVATNGNGFGGKAPLPGDAPTVLFEIDQTSPTVKMNVEPVTRDGAIDIRWEVSDKNLTADPIHITYAEQASGPWHQIATKLKNDGHYHWALPRDVPTRILIRLEARDLAGNIAWMDTPNQISVDLTEPDINLVNVSPVASGSVPANAGR